MEMLILARSLLILSAAPLKNSDRLRKTFPNKK
jgi:hypothetical protein